MVSPRARPRPSTVAPMIPERTQGSVTLLRHLPVGHAQGRCPLLGQRGDLQEEVPGGGGDDGHDHQGQHDAGREQAFTGADRVAEVPQDRDVGHVVGDDGVDVGGQERPQGEDAPTGR